MKSVVTLCGSTRFQQAFDLANMHLTLMGHVVIGLGCNGHADYPQGAKFLTGDNNDSGEIKRNLNILHFRKIDLADEIFVINVGGYIGESTRKEIEYAKSKGKHVRYMFAPQRNILTQEELYGIRQYAKLTHQQAAFNTLLEHIDALTEKCDAAEQDGAETAKLAGSNAARVQKAEAELVRREELTGKKVATVVRDDTVESFTSVIVVADGVNLPVGTKHYAAPVAPVDQHPDDIAFDKFAVACKAKLATSRKKGRNGWDNPLACSHKMLADLLMQHLLKGNPGTFEDVANFAMMLHQRDANPEVLAEAAKGERFTPNERAAVEAALNKTPVVPDEITDSIPRAKELAERLVEAGPKAWAVSASETHEICDFILMVVKYLAAAPSPSAEDGDDD